MKKNATAKERGFTIVEIMIATAVLSVILLLASMVIIGIGHLYSKGVNQAGVQGTTRTALDDLSQALETSNSYTEAAQDYGAPSIHVISKCINNTRYTYTIGHQMGSNPSSQVAHVLWRDTYSGPCAALDLTQDDPEHLSVSPGTDGVELMSPRSRLTALCIQNPGNLYKITLGVAYGDDDLLNNPAGDPTCDPAAPAPDTVCKNQVGDQFCATSKLQTNVVKRLTSG